MKSVCKAPKIELGALNEEGRHEFVDVTRWFASIDLMIALGDLNTCKLTLIDDPEIIEITKDERRYKFACADTIRIGGLNISDHVTGYDRVVRMGRRDTIVLHIQCDPETLRVNGTTPWVDAGDLVTHYEVLDNVRAARQWARRTYSHPWGDTDGW